MLEKQANRVFLGIGSNLGNKKLNIENAKLHLELNKNFRIFKTSKFYSSRTILPVLASPSKSSSQNM